MIQFRATTAASLDFVLSAERHAENRPYITQWTQQQHEDAIADADMGHWLIEPVRDPHPVGYAIAAGLTSPHGSVEVVRLVVTEKGKGYGRATLKLLQRLAFEQWQAHRLWLDVKDHNHRAHQLYLSVGFVEEGRLRECLYTDGRYESLIILSMLRSEYQP